MDSESYAEWDLEPHARWIDAGNTFGRHLMRAAKDYALRRIPATLTGEARAAAERAALDAIYGVMMLLDGVAASNAGPDHIIEYALISRIRERVSGAIVESVELTPDGDGLCLGFAGWSVGDFGA